MNEPTDDAEPGTAESLRLTVWEDENKAMETQYGPMKFLRWLGLEQERFERAGKFVRIIRLGGRAALFRSNQEAA